MIPVKIKVKNFLSYRDNVPVLDLEGVHVACLCGDNGHGKSALLDAVTWALWGSARTRLQEELIYQGESEMSVDLEFNAGDNRFRVARRFARANRGRQGATFLELFQASADGYVPITGNSVRETEAKIRSLLHMDYDTFVNSAFLLQGRADMFTTSTPGKRKELLGDVLGLGWYERLSEKARIITREKTSLASSIQLEISNIDKDVLNKDRYQERLDGINIESKEVDAKISNIELGIEDLLNKIQERKSKEIELLGLKNEEKRIILELKTRETQVNSYMKSLNELTEKSNRLDQIEADLLLSNKTLQSISVFPESIQSKKENLNNSRSQMTVLEDNNTVLKKEMEDLRIKVDLLEQQTRSVNTLPICPVCGQELGEQGCQALANTYESDGKQKAAKHRENDALIRDMEIQYHCIDEEVAKAEKEHLANRSSEEKRRDLLYKDMESAKASRQIITQISSGLENEKSLLELSTNRLNQIDGKVDGLKSQIKSLTNLSDNYEAEKMKLDTLKIQREQISQDVGILRGSLMRIEELQVLRDKRIDELGYVSNEKSVYEQLSIAFGKDGIQALLIEQAIPELESEADGILGRITDYRMSVKLETQRESRSGGDPRETLDIKISDELGIRNYETYSGGEAFRINFALRIALSKLLAHRSGAPLPTLFIDEGFGTQDTNGLEKLVDAIRVIQDDFQRIIVITHIDELKEAFPARIEVTKTSQGSTFSLN